VKNEASKKLKLIHGPEINSRNIPVLMEVLQIENLNHLSLSQK